MCTPIALSDSTEVRRYGEIGGTRDDVLKLAKKLAATHPGMELRFCYEAGPHGYPLCRCLRAHGYDCILVAPRRGERVKTNRRDQLARLHGAGELTAIYVPDPQDEAARAPCWTGSHRQRYRRYPPLCRSVLAARNRCN
jgi:transposase